MRKFTLLVFMGLFCSAAFGQQNFFTDAGENNTFQTSGQRVTNPLKYRAATLDVSAMRTFLWSLPSEKNVADRSQSPVLSLPMPDGKMAKFHVWESSIMEPGLAAKFPEMRTFAGQGIDDPYATIRFDYNPYFGFSAQILSPVSGRIYIDPYARRDINNYISYYNRDRKHTEHFICDVPENPDRPSEVEAGPCRGTQLFTYRLALACTGEYAVAVAGVNPTIPAVAAAMLTSVNRVTGVYELDLSIRLTLVSNNNLLIYLNGGTDPYTNGNRIALLSENQANIDALIGSAFYDIGHVFSTAGGGLAGLGVVCINGQKARGETGTSNPVGDGFDIDYVAHEMGHQFGADHSFNSVTSSCNGNRAASEAYEVGSGTTVMAYAGICGTDDIQPHSDPFFHAISFDRISLYVGTQSCHGTIATGNTLPVITAMNNNGVSIPTLTPFTLTGSATDANGDPLTYCWEEWDLGPSGAWNSGATSTTAPLFKSRVPKTAGERTFPDMAVILAGYPANPSAVMGGLKGETLPQVARAMKFRLTVRDNRAGGGGVVSGGEGCQGGFTGTFQVNVTNSSPFLVTAPNGGENYAGGTTQTITWDPAATASAPINVTNVKISLSTDGGFTYPTILAASTTNDGSEALTIPSIVTTTARIKIEAIGNIFFDISNANFIISSVPSGFLFNSPAPVSSACPAGASMISAINVIAFGGYVSPVTLSATGNPAGTTVSFSPNPVTPSAGGGTPVTITFSGTNTLANGNYDITVNGVGPSAPNQSRVVRFTINPGAAPVITTQPATQVVCQGGIVTFLVAATGTNLTYQWQKSTDGGNNWSNIGGATGASYSIASVQLTDAAQYRSVVTGQCGSGNSNAAILTVRQLPTVTLTASQINLLPGQSSTLTATPGASTGGILTTAWLYNGVAPVPPITGNTYIANVEHVGTYQVLIQETFTGPALVCSNQSAIVTITATPSPKLFIFPSPNDGRFTVSYYNNGGTSTKRTITIFDSKGSMVYSQQFNIAGAYTLIPIDLRTGNTGIYYVVVGDADGKKLATGKVHVR